MVQAAIANEPAPEPRDFLRRFKLENVQAREIECGGDLNTVQQPQNLHAGDVHLCMDRLEFLYRHALAFPIGHTDSPSESRRLGEELGRISQCLGNRGKPIRVQLVGAVLNLGNEWLRDRACGGQFGLRQPPRLAGQRDEFVVEVRGSVPSAARPDVGDSPAT